MNSLLRTSALRTAAFLFLFTLVVWLPGCGNDDSIAAAPSGQETPLEHAKQHLDPTYVCPMHPQVVRSEPGRCPICGMDLVAKPAKAGAPEMAPARAVPSGETTLEHARKHLDPTYVCPMHPQVVRSEPGRCPVCGMDLVAKEPPAAAGHERPASGGGATVTVSDAVVNQLGVRTAPVRRGTLTRHIEAFGTFLGGTGSAARFQTKRSDRGQDGADGAALFVSAEVFERDSPRVHQGQPARVRFPTLGATEWKGKVVSLATQISPLTRTLQFNVLVDVEGTRIPSGMSAVLTLEADPIADVLLVPREAVIATGKGARVIVARGAGRFEQRWVQAEDVGEDEMVIHSGLAEGEQVVVSAQFLLDSEANLQAGLSRLSGGEPPAAMAEDPATPQADEHETATHQGAMPMTGMPDGTTAAGAVPVGAAHQMQPATGITDGMDMPGHTRHQGPPAEVSPAAKPGAGLPAAAHPDAMHDSGGSAPAPRGDPASNGTPSPTAAGATVPAAAADNPGTPGSAVLDQPDDALSHQSTQEAAAPVASTPGAPGSAEASAAPAMPAEGGHAGAAQ
jgi:Cu(I)/Ag(I) efflux system membrane fusion protein